MSEESINRATRRSRKARPLGPDARCWQCGYPETSGLGRHNRKIWCYECWAARQEKTTTEQHHLLGKANDPTTVGVPGNLHRAISDAQHDWPNETRYNRDRDPLLWLAALFRSLHSIGRCVIDWLESFARFFEQLSRTLRHEYGARWWQTLQLDALWQHDQGDLPGQFA
jgi:hypothetical protein